MRQVFFFFTIIFFSIRLQAQQGYFISIDSDGNQPFSVMLGKKNYTSSGTGHLIIPNLRDSSYQLAINFPNSSYAEHFFTISLDKKDKGYQLKKNAERGWSLQDWQTMIWIKADKVEQVDFSRDFQPSLKSKDAFAKMMAAVVNDSAVLFATPPKPEVVAKTEEKKKEQVVTEKKPEPVKDSPTVVKANEKKTISDTTYLEKKIAVAPKTNIDSPRIKSQKDSAAIAVTKKPVTIDSANSAHKPVAKPKTDDSVTIAKKTNDGKDSGVAKNKSTPAEPVLKDNENKKVVEEPAKHIVKISRLTEKWTNTTREILYTDNSEGKLDTINVVIELEEKKPMKDTSAIVKKDTSIVEKRPAIVATDSIEKKEPKPEVKEEVKKDTLKQAAPIIKPLEAKPGNDSSLLTKRRLAIINSDCKNFATDVDVDKLRIKMLAENSLDDRIVIARKVFRTKCFTTRQVKALTELFVNDKTRYAFFDAAYPFVSDTGNFKELVDLLTDPYYVDRFKAMVRLQ